MAASNRYQVQRNTTGYPAAFGGGPSRAASAYARRVQPQRPVSQSLAQVANQRVDQQLNPQIAALNSFGQNQNQAIQAFAQALLGKLQPIAGQVGQAYDSAIQQQGALSGQAAQYLSGQNPSGKVAELLRAAGAPAAQQQQVVGQLGQTFGGGAGVLAFTGGAIPGGQLAADKAAAVGEAAQLPGFAALRGQQDLAGALYQQKQDRMSLEATRPALYQQAAQDIRQNNAARNQAAATAAQNRIVNKREASNAAERVREFKVGEADKAASETAASGRAAAAARERRYEFDVTQKGEAADRAAKKAALAVTRQWQQFLQKAKGDPKLDTSVSNFVHYASDQYGQPWNGVYTFQAGYKQDPKGAPGAAVKIAASKKPAKPPSVNTTLSAANGYLTDTSGRPVLQGGKRVPYKPAAGKPGSKPRASSSLSAGNGYLTDTYGNPILRDGKRVPYKSVSQTEKGQPQLSASQQQKYAGEITETVNFLRSGVPDTQKANGDTIAGKPALNYTDALAFMQTHGYMATPQLAKLTMAALRRRYPRNEIKITNNKVAGPPTPSATTPPAAG